MDELKMTKGRGTWSSIAELVGRGNEEIMLRVDTKAAGYEVCQDGAGTPPCGHMRRFVQT